MANTKVDLNGDKDLSQEACLDALLEWSLSVDFLLNSVQELQVFKEFHVYVPQMRMPVPTSFQSE